MPTFQKGVILNMITLILILLAIGLTFCFVKNNKKKVAKIEEAVDKAKEEIKKKVKKG